jgi:hypothetical protein
VPLILLGLWLLVRAMRRAPAGEPVAAQVANPT